MSVRAYKGFTIVELLVVISIIALLIGILLPAIGKARQSALLRMSEANLRNIGAAHQMYASEWNDRQCQFSRDNFGAHGNSLTEYESNHGAYDIPLGWADGSLWIHGHHASHYEPIVFEGPEAGFGYFREPNNPAFTEYLSGRMYDPVFWAPKDRVLLDRGAEECFEHPGDLCLPSGVPVYIHTSYCSSPAALYSPDVFRNERRGGFQDPWSLPAGFRAPSLSQSRFPELKTHMLEHNWLQSPPTPCNPNFTGCTPYFFNHGYESRPCALFYDGHVDVTSTQEAIQAHEKLISQSGGELGLWSKDTPLGGQWFQNAPGAYFMGDAYDSTSTSFHVLTTDGILGRDIGGGY